MEEIIYIIQHTLTKNPVAPSFQQEIINNLSFIAIVPTTTMFILYAMYEEYFNC